MVYSRMFITIEDEEKTTITIRENIGESEDDITIKDEDENNSDDTYSDDD